MNQESVIVVGNTIAALTAASRLADLGALVWLVSPLAIQHAVPFLDPEPFNAVQGVQEAEHFALQTLKHGGFLASQDLVQRMWQDSWGMLNMLAKLGVPFERSVEGRFLKKITADGFPSYYAPDSTRFHIHRALVGQVWRFVQDGRIQLLEHHEPLSLVLRDGSSSYGLVYQDLRTMAIDGLPAKAVVIATEGMARLFGHPASLEFLDSGFLAGQQLFFANMEDLATGGLFTDETLATSYSSVFAAGCTGMIHGMRPLSGNTLPYEFYTGLKSAEVAHKAPELAPKNSAQVFAQAIRSEVHAFEELLDQDGPENIMGLNNELTSLLSQLQKDFSQADPAILEGFNKRVSHVGVADKSAWMNRDVIYARRLRRRLDLAKIVIAAMFARHKTPKSGYKFTKTRLIGEQAEVYFQDVDLKYYQPEVGIRVA